MELQVIFETYHPYIQQDKDEPTSVRVYIRQVNALTVYSFIKTCSLVYPHFILADDMMHEYSVASLPPTKLFKPDYCAVFLN